MKKTIDGKTINVMLLDSCITFVASPVSLYSHASASIDVIGREMMIAPIKGIFLLIIETLAMIRAEIKVLIRKSIILPPDI